MSKILKEVLYDISEIFSTVQGEGRYTGVPAIFIRLGQCNLNCGYCDTAYTWAFTENKAVLHEDGKAYDSVVELERMSVAKIMARVSQLSGLHKYWHVVITGGEPLFWNRTLHHLLGALLKAGYFIELETNGTIKPTEEVAARVSQFNVSPKLENSGNKLNLRERRGAYELFVEFSRHVMGEKVIFKYVVQTVKDMSEVLVLQDRYNIPADIIYLMPEGRTEKVIQERSAWIIDICKQYGFRFCQRAHIMVYGARRGV